MTIATTRADDLDVEAYRREGYTVLPQLLPRDAFDGLRACFERKWAALPAGARPEDMDVPHFSDPALFEWLLHPAVLDVMERILGPDIALFSAHFFCKPPVDGKGVPWHDDAYFWRETIRPSSEAVTVWLALDPVDEQNGCMQVIPGSHAARQRRYHGVESDLRACLRRSS